MNFNRIDTTVATHFVPAIINGDTTGLDDTEDAQLDAFLDYMTAAGAAGHFDIICNEPAFTTCAVCSMQAECVTVAYFYPSSESN